MPVEWRLRLDDTRLCNYAKRLEREFGRLWRDEADMPITNGDSAGHSALPTWSSAG
jgi:hypothetical protein